MGRVVKRVRVCLHCLEEFYAPKASSRYCARCRIVAIDKNRRKNARDYYKRQRALTIAVIGAIMEKKYKITLTGRGLAGQGMAWQGKAGQG
jgi:hypothetical protein